MNKAYELEEITPKELRCGAGPCPAVYVAREVKRCVAGLGCPGIYESSKESYFIIGKKIDPKLAGLEGKVAAHEGLIEVPKGLIDGMKR